MGKCIESGDEQCARGRERSKLAAFEPSDHYHNLTGYYHLTGQGAHAGEGHFSMREGRVNSNRRGVE